MNVMFVRVKKIKGFRYAYRVENVWKKRKKASRQKVKGYLGKVHKLSLVNDHDFFEFVGSDAGSYISSNSKEQIVADLVKHSLVQHGFDEAGKLVSNGSFMVDIEQMDFSDDKKNIVFEMNEGFMCKDTVNRLVKFKAAGEGERELGIKLASAFLEAGIMVPEEVFIGFFKKIVK